ncbi:hypothetical protein GCM10010915_01440 [Microbacterium faecale]|uniref:HTH luxR-type domain-containing protein n=1 Tax=Microbacterium faecale TaxID=1804630 RepID=A0A916Y0A2_9MICO|nr:hypothetical protein GCM10010915_01440 [Microbacterium faecale]
MVRVQGTDRDRLSRPRLVSLWRRVTAGATVLVTAQHDSGVASSVREWVAETGDRLIEWSSNRVDVPAETPDADVVLLEIEGMLGTHVTAALAVRERWPAATLIAVSSTQWPPGLLDAGMRPERVFPGSQFGFTTDETLDRAEQLGLALTWDEASGLLERVGTHAGLVDAILRAATSHGSLDEAAVRTGCDALVSHFAGAAAAGVFRPNGWRAVLVSARIGPMPRRTLLEVWGRDEVVRAAFDNVLQAGFFVQDPDSDMMQLRPDIRAAVIDRIEREARLDAVDADVAALASRFLSEGRTDDGWSIVADLPAARTRLLVEHWWLLGEFDVAHARPWLEEAITRSASPELRVALIRCLIDVTSANHTGHVSQADRRVARDLLDETDGVEMSVGALLLADTLRGVLLRLDGHHGEALETHERLADSVDRVHDDADDGAPSLAQANLLLHAGISAIDASRSDIASDRFAAAAALAHSSKHDRLARYAHEMLLLVTTNSGRAPLPSTFQARVDNLVGAHVITPPMSNVVKLSSALYIVDPRGLQEALDDEAPAVDDPLMLRFIDLALRSFAHGLLGTSGLAARAIELFERELDGRDLTANHRALLVWARTEALLHAGAADRAVELLTETRGLRAVIPVDVLLARAALRAKKPERALAALASTQDAYGSGVLAVWSHLLLFLAYHAIGSDSSLEVAHQHLSTALVAGSRARPLLPFAAQGMSALGTTLTQADQLALDPAGRRYIADVERMRDELQLATSTTLALSERERVVVAHLVAAESTRDLAARLHVSPNTVKTQLRSIYRKLGVSSWADAVATAKRLGLV